MILAIIPARGGSKGIPRKNLQEVLGVPLVTHTIRHAQISGLVDHVVVSTDDAEIATVAAEAGAEVVRRPAEIAGDTVPSESALLHVLEEFAGHEVDDPELLVFLQATSPVRRSEHIDGAICQIFNCNRNTIKRLQLVNIRDQSVNSDFRIEHSEVV